jgi:hypothetical protein
MRAIYLDMDGTIAGLYNYPNWLDLLHAEDVRPYSDCDPIDNIAELDNLLNEFVALGITIGIISWGAMNGSNKYTRATKKAKVAWCKKYLTCVSEYHVVKYGTPKHKVAKIKDSILVDDNANVRNTWKNGATVDASNSENMVKELRNMLETLKAA